MSESGTAYAKINLALHVRRRRGDGYHDIETIFAFADFGDVVEAVAAQQLSLGVSGRFGASLAADRGNLVIRTAEALAQRHHVTTGASLKLDKRLPVASGIGGGSADAAATLRILNSLWRINADEAGLAELGAELGADVPACVTSRTMRGEGIGDQLRPIEDNALKGTSVVLVNPLLPLSTAAVFRAWDGIDRGPLADLPAVVAGAGRNDLEAPAIALCPPVANVLQCLRSQDGAGLVRMSGSGASCFALFGDNLKAVEAERTIARAYPEWWVERGKLR